VIARLPGYAEALSLGRSSGGILLDAGCCCAPYFLCPSVGDPKLVITVGLDARKAALDGWPANRIVATDIVPGEYRASAGGSQTMVF
jgi:hypothetical protein